MARYNLIIKDKSYVKLIDIAGREGKTLGKFLNEIIEAYLEGVDEIGRQESNEADSVQESQ